MDEERLAGIMEKSNQDTLRLMHQSGTDALGRMHGHIDSLHSKNGTLMGLSFGVISIVLVFSIEYGWLERPELRLPLMLFSTFMSISIVCSLVTFRPKDYGEVGSFDDKFLYGNLEKAPADLLRDQIITIKDALDDCGKQYKNDVRLFWAALIPFMMSLLMLAIGLY